MKSHVVRATDAASRRDTEELNPAIEILVVDRVLIMPFKRPELSHFVGKKRPAIDSRLGLDRLDGRSRPGKDRRGHAHRGANGRKGETRGAGDSELTVGDVVVHVAFPGVSLAPGVLMRSDQLRFAVIGRARIHRGVEVVSFHQNPVRRAVVSVAGVTI